MGANGQRPAIHQSPANSVRREPSFILAPDALGVLPPLPQMLVCFLRVAQNETKDLVNVRQGKRRVLSHNVFRGCSVVERPDHGVESDAGSADPDDSIRVSGQRNNFWRLQSKHSLDHVTRASLAPGRAGRKLRGTCRLTGRPVSCGGRSAPVPGGSNFPSPKCLVY